MATATKKSVKTNDVELNRWCIEMAMRWPVVSHGGYGQASAYGSMPPINADADVIGRAAKIKAWVERGSA